MLPIELDQLPQPAPIDTEARDHTNDRLNSLAKPPGSLGKLEALVAQHSACTGSLAGKANHKTVFVFAGNHGVAEKHEITPFPSSVTNLMVQTYLSEKAVVNSLAASASAKVSVVACGEGLEPKGQHQGKMANLRGDWLPASTQDISKTAAMTQDELSLALSLGIQSVTEETSRGVVVIGEMGIGNTTVSAALAAALLGGEPRNYVGTGTGSVGPMFERKINIVETAVARLDETTKGCPLRLLQELGGFEIVAMVGAYLQAAYRQNLIFMDGFISSVAALYACKLQPTLKEFLVATTQSTEPGHEQVLGALRVEPPLLDWHLRLGEGSAGALCLTLLDSGLALLHNVATLDEVLS